MKISNVSYNCNCSLVANRYYNPRISQFYATDPLAEKYPNFSPYTYTADNPVMLVDPDGKKIKVSFRTGFLGIFGKKVTLTYDSKNQYWIGADGKKYTGKMSKFVKRVWMDLKKNQENILGKEIVHNLSNDKLEHFIKNGDPNSNRSDTDDIYYYGSYYNNQRIFQGGKSGSTPGYAVLGHEMAHKYSKNLGVKNFSWFGEGIYERGVDEYNAMYYENVLRKTNGLPLRIAYAKIDGKLEGKIIDNHGMLQTPPTYLMMQGTQKILPFVHIGLIIKKLRL